MSLINKTPNALILALLLVSGQAIAHPITDTFDSTAFVKTPKIVSCTLENGDATQCYELTVPYQPKKLEIGPFCPPTLDEAGGLWDWDGKNPGLYRLNGEFFKMVAELGYRFYDESGKLSIVDVRLDQPSGEGNSCLSASADESVTMTLRLPIQPVMAKTPTDLGTVAKVGVALDGVPIFADAPSVLDRGHLPALDVCGGHIDPGGWYHWHATATDIGTALKAENVTADCTQTQDASAQFGYAFDGFPMHGSLESDGSKPTGLDKCGGHIGLTNSGKTYHYHASESFPNLPVCLVGVMAEDNFSTTASKGIGSSRNGQRRGPDFEKIATMLGISSQSLMEAMGAAGGRDADLAEVAKQLNVDEETLRKALPRRQAPKPLPEATKSMTQNPLVGIGEVKVVASGFKSTEGPVWHSASNTMLFTDIPGNTIYGLETDTLKLTKVRNPSDTSNGLALDSEGYLLAAEQKNRSITRMNLSTGEVKPFIETVNLEGKPYRFNSPNDMAVHANGNVYFTDPPFGIRRTPEKRELDFNGVFVRLPDGNIKIIKKLAETENPNGIIFNPEQSVLYLAVSHDESGPILAYDVDAQGNLSNEREFARAQNTDGMAMDVDGNLYVATRTGIKVWSPEGKEWGRIDLPQQIRTTNIAFGGNDKNTLYITNRSADLYAVTLKVKGHQ